MRNITISNDKLAELFPFALDEVKSTMIEGEKKYGKRNSWKIVDKTVHLRHMYDHLVKILAPITNGEDLEFEEVIMNASHLVARGMMVIENEHRKKRHFG
jgi:hypothetical protein